MARSRPCSRAVRTRPAFNQDVWKYLMHYRELALVDRDERFAAVAEQIVDRVIANPASFAISGYLGRRVPGRGARLP